GSWMSFRCKWRLEMATSFFPSRLRRSARPRDSITSAINTAYIVEAIRQLRQGYQLVREYANTNDCTVTYNRAEMYASVQIEEMPQNLSKCLSLPADWRGWRAGRCRSGADEASSGHSDRRCAR